MSRLRTDDVAGAEEDAPPSFGAIAAVLAAADDDDDGAGGNTFGNVEGPGMGYGLCPRSV